MSSERAPLTPVDRTWLRMERPVSVDAGLMPDPETVLQAFPRELEHLAAAVGHSTGASSERAGQ